MKKFLTFLVVITAGMASAASFSWTSSKLSFGETVLKNTAMTAYLIYVGNNTAHGASVTVTKDSTAESIASSFGTSAKVAKDYSVTASRTGILTDDFSFSASGGEYASKDVFALLLSYTSEGKTYFNLSSVDSAYTLSVPGENPDIATYATADFSFGNSVVGESNSLSSGGGWTVAVPEPSTAALALAGLALLLKRRKA